MAEYPGSSSEQDPPPSSEGTVHKAHKASYSVDRVVKTECIVVLLEGVVTYMSSVEAFATAIKL